MTTNTKTNKHLIEALGRYLGASSLVGGANIRTQQRLYDAYRRQYDRVLLGGLLSEHDESALHHRAMAWWNERPVKGAGIDW